MIFVVHAECKYCRMRFVQENGSIEEALMIMFSIACSRTPHNHHVLSDITIGVTRVRGE